MNNLARLFLFASLAAASPARSTALLRRSPIDTVVPMQRADQDPLWQESSREAFEDRRIDMLLTELLSRDTASVSYATEALQRVGAPAIGPLVEALRSAEGAGKVNYVATLGAIADEWGLGEHAGPAVDALAETLEVASSSARVGAARILAKAGAPSWKALPALEKALGNSQGIAQEEILYALLKVAAREGQLPEPLRELIGGLVLDLADADAVVSLSAVRKLGNMGRAPVPFLVAALKECDDDAAKGQIIRTLGQIGPDASRAIPDLTECLDDQEHSIRSRAIEALGSIGSASSVAVPELVRLMRTRGDMHGQYAAKALGEIGSGAKEAVPLLVERALQSDSEVDRCVALEALGKIGAADEQVLDAITSSLRSEDALTRIYAVGALVDLGPAAEPALEQLIRALNDPDQLVRSRAVEALGDLTARPSRVASALMLALRDGRPMVRRLAATSIGKVSAGTALESDPDLAGALEKLVLDKDSGVRSAGLEARGLSEVRLQRAMRFLEGSLQDEDDRVRAACVPFLERDAGSSQAALDALKELAGDRSLRVRDAAGQALWRLAAGDR